MKLIRIGLTGGSGAGKSTVSGLLCELGFYPIDADAVYHQLIRPGQPGHAAILAHFPDVLDQTGEIDRKKLGDLVFSNVWKRKKLNEITHSLVLARMSELAETAKRRGAYRGILFDVPLLFESGADRLCDTTIAVIAPREQRIRRLLSRDGAVRSRIEARLAAQPENDYYTRRAAHTIINDGDLPALRAKTLALAGQILKQYDQCGLT